MGQSFIFTLIHITKYFRIFHIYFVDCLESFEFNRAQQNMLSMKLQISSLFKTQKTRCLVMKRMRLGSSVYPLLPAFSAIFHNEKKLDYASNGVANSSIPVRKMLRRSIHLAKIVEFKLACASLKNYCALSLYCNFRSTSQYFVHYYDSI